MEESKSFWNYFSKLWRTEKNKNKEYLAKKANSHREIKNESPTKYDQSDSKDPSVPSNNHTNGVQNHIIKTCQSMPEPSDKSNSVQLSVADLPTPRSKLYRNLTCSIDLSDRSIKLMNTNQFKRIESPNVPQRRPSIDLETTKDNLGQLEPISNFEELEVIGTGAFGRAIKVRHIISDRLFVMKEMLTQSIEDEESLRKEVGLLRRLEHDNILVLEGLVLKEKRICLLTELMTNGSLQAKILDLESHLSVLQKVQFLLDISAGMEYLHSNSIMHRDLTSLNCLLSETNRVVVSDFGLSKFLPDFHSRRRLRNRRTIFNFHSIATSKSHEDLSGDTKNSSFLQIPLAHPLQNTSRSNNSYIRELSVSVEDNLNCGTPIFLDNREHKYSNPCTPDINKSRKFASPSTPDVAQTRKASKYQNLKRKHTQVGSPFWMAPEMMANTKYSPQVDLYSFGVIGCEVTGRVNSDPDCLERRSKDMSVNFPAFLDKNCHELEQCPTSLMEMIGLCCEPRPEMRPSFSLCVSWLEDIKFKLTTDYPIKSDWFPVDDQSETDSDSY